MTALIFLFTATCFGQTWNTPVISEAELAPPGEISATPSSGTAASNDLESGNEFSAQPVTELQWEYDEEGQPVARPVTSAPVQSAPKESAPEPVVEPQAVSTSPDIAQDKSTGVRGSRQAATFWFMLMNR
ncbi:MAG: hypothetical protein GX130_06420 [Candidatus Hydrogenedens sp.]|jgi:hypothetical protein|nr:hypothetical protein [Candidatus Hydrogenedens sp.]